MFILALAFVTFSAGIVVAHLRLPPYELYAEALQGGRAWMKKRQNESQPLGPKRELARQKDMETQGGEQERGQARLLTGIYGQAGGQSSEADGYTLVARKFAPSLLLLDKTGNIRHSWTMPFYTAFPGGTHLDTPLPEKRIYIMSARLYPNGDMLVLYQGKGDTPYGYGLIRLDRDSKILWTLPETTHHDVSVDDRGRIHVLQHAFAQGADLSVKRNLRTILNDKLLTLSAQGQKLSEITVLEAFRGTPFERLIRNISGFDMTHTNSIQALDEEMAAVFPMFQPGYLLISMRNQNMLAVIDPRIGKVVWAIRGIWKHQHQAQFTADGNILFLDNLGKGKQRSRVLKVNPATMRVEWEYAGQPRTPFFSSHRGGVQAMGSGNYFIYLTPPSYMMEVSPDKQTVWQQKIRHEGDLEFAHHYPAGYPAFLLEK